VQEDHVRPRVAEAPTKVPSEASKMNTLIIIAAVIVGVWGMARSREK